MTPQWKHAEADFQAYWARFGKRAWCHRFSDTAQAKGMNGPDAIAPAQPSDFLVCHDGVMFLAEVKYTIDLTAFHHKGVRPKQWGCARMSIPAGGLYFFFIKSAAMGKWYRVPARVLIDSKAKSTKWTELEDYVFDLS